MKKLTFGALALALLIGVVSCRNENTETTGETVEETAINEETPMEMTTEEEDSLQVETETVIDSLGTSETEVEQEAAVIQ